MLKLQFAAYADKHQLPRRLRAVLGHLVSVLHARPSRKVSRPDVNAATVDASVASVADTAELTQASGGTDSVNVLSESSSLAARRHSP